MTPIESIMLFLIFVCAFTCIMVMGNDINNLKYKVSVILDVINDCLKILDDDFHIQNEKNSNLNGPIYGPMLEDEEE